MFFGNRYSSFTRIALWNIRDNNKIRAQNYSRTDVYFERFSVVLGHIPNASCCKQLLVTKTSFLRKLASTLALYYFSPSQKLTESRATRYPYGTYL